MALTEQQTDEILEILDMYARYYSEKNAEKILSLVSKGISGFGSGPDEIVPDFSQFKENTRRDFGQAENISITFYIFRLDGQMPFAWMTAFCVIDADVGGEKMTMEGRMTALLRNTGSRWLFEQVHFSMPYMEQFPGESFPGSAE
ncbi:MAG TPA: nuclear transport factor 2 family protein [Methanoregulaceae archaeon]|nr:nuclear transport factor 2 family protein [Methanoregulaceae archaeon]